MFLSELLEAVQGEPGQKTKLTGGAYYKPKYDEDKKQLLGSVSDWMKSLDISKDDIQQALEIFKKSEIFKKAERYRGMSYEERGSSEKNGTLSFNTVREDNRGRTFTAQYKIYANGQIRYVSNSWFGKEAMTRLASPKPRVKAGDPVGSLVGMWSAALEEVLNKWEKALDKMMKMSNNRD